MYAALRDRDPVHFVADGDYWVLSRFADVFDAARDTATFSSADGLTFTYGEREKIGLAEAAPMVMMDPPEHTAFRRLVGRGFTPRHVREIEPAVRSFVVERLERLRLAGTGDVVAELFKPLPSFVVASYLGVPESDRSRFDDWTDAIVAANANGDPLGAGGAVAGLFGYFSELIEAKRRKPGDDTISALVAGSFAATKEMARLLGEEEFTAMFHQGERDNIQLSLVGDRTLLTILFDDRTTVGMVRLYASETAKKLADVYREAMERGDQDPGLGEAYGTDAKKTLDKLFD